MSPRVREPARHASGLRRRDGAAIAQTVGRPSRWGRLRAFGAVSSGVDWSVSSLALVVGILLVLRGLATASSRPSDGGVRTVNVVLGTLEALAGIRDRRVARGWT